MAKICAGEEQEAMSVNEVINRRNNGVEDILGESYLRSDIDAKALQAMENLRQIRRNLYSIERPKT